VTTKSRRKKLSRQRTGIQEGMHIIQSSEIKVKALIYFHLQRKKFKALVIPLSVNGCFL